MTWRILAVVTAAAIWAGIVPAASVENALVGTWQLKSFSLVVVDTKETSRPYGENPTGYIQFSPGGHMVMFLAAGGLKPPASGSYTDADRATFIGGLLALMQGPIPSRETRSPTMSLRPGARSGLAEIKFVISRSMGQA